LRELQPEAPGRAAQRRDLHDPLRGPGSHRKLAPSLQRRQTALVTRLPTAGTTDHLAASPWPALRSASVSPRAGQSGRSLTLELVSLKGADHSVSLPPCAKPCMVLASP